MSDYKRLSERLSAVRQNMANKMVAGIDYDREEEEVVELSAQLRAIESKTA